MTLYEKISTGIAILGLLGGAIGFVVGIAARRKAGESERVAQAARSQSVEALRKSAEALSQSASAHDRAATASERVAEVWEEMASKPEPRPEFDVKCTADRSVGWITNTGNIGARSVSIAGLPEPAKSLVGFGRPVDIPPKESVQFNIDERFSLSVEQVVITWYDDRSPEDQQTETHWLTEA